MSDTKLLYFEFDKNNPERFFTYLRDIIVYWKRDVKIYISDSALESLKCIAKKTLHFSDNKILIMAFKIDNNYIDIICDKYNNVIEIAFGPISKKRKTYRPYIRKKASRKLYICIKSL